MSLADVTIALKQFTAAMAPAPTRDALVLERDRLLAAVPPVPADTLGLALRRPPACRCETCAHEYEAEREKLVTFAAWEGRVRTLETRLVRLTWGDANERDALGDELVALCAEIMAAHDQTRLVPWERITTFDGRGRPTGAYETGPGLAERIRDLVALYRHARDRAQYLGAEELRRAIDDTRARMQVVLATPLQRPLDPKIAHQAGTEPGRPDGDAERAGLWPNPASPNVLEGRVKFGRS